MHRKDFVYNDLKNDNISVSRATSSSAAHLTDFRLATRIDNSSCLELFGLPYNLEQEEFVHFRSPELKKGRPLQPSIGRLQRQCANVGRARIDGTPAETSAQERLEKVPLLRTVGHELEYIPASMTEEQQEEAPVSKSEVIDYPSRTQLATPQY